LKGVIEISSIHMPQATSVILVQLPGVHMEAVVGMGMGLVEGSPGPSRFIFQKRRSPSQVHDIQVTPTKSLGQSIGEVQIFVRLQEPILF
jgi:hypothetical protein